MHRLETDRALGTRRGRLVASLNSYLHRGAFWNIQTRSKMSKSTNTSKRPKMATLSTFLRGMTVLDSWDTVKTHKLTTKVELWTFPRVSVSTFWFGKLVVGFHIRSYCRNKVNCSPLVTTSSDSLASMTSTSTLQQLLYWCRSSRISKYRSRTSSLDQTTAWHSLITAASTHGASTTRDSAASKSFTIIKYLHLRDCFRLLSVMML